MTDYERSTTRTSFDALPEPVCGAVLARAEASQLTLAEDAQAFLTHSRRLRKPGLFGRLTGANKDTEHLTAVVLGAKDLLVATHGEQRGTAVLAARLEDVDVGSSVDRLAAEMGDDGVTVTGFPAGGEGTTARASFFVGLGPPDGREARAALEDAVRQAKS